MKKEILLLLSFVFIGFIVYTFLPNPVQVSKKEKILEEDSYKQKELNKTFDQDFLSFDVVRITRSGDAVIAGRSRPNESVVLFDGEEQLAIIKADNNGEWVWTSETPLSPGVKRLFLRSETEQEKIVNSKQTIIVFLEDNSNDPIILKSLSDGQALSTILNLEKINEGIVLDLVEYSSSGKIMLSGRTTPMNKVDFFIDELKIGEVVSDQDGFWSFISKKDINYGPAVLKITGKSNGKIMKISSKIFKDNYNSIKSEINEKKFIVQPGNSLWRIARKTLGGGILFSEIYKKNIVKINNPDLIFPGQVFDLPLISTQN